MPGFLERLLGKPIQYYENLMRSKRERTQISPENIRKLQSALQPVILQATAYHTVSAPILIKGNNLKNHPTDKKGNPLPYWGKIVNDGAPYAVFMNAEKLTSNTYASFIALVPKEQWQPWLHNQTHSSWTSKKVDSLPIWEEVIHRFPEIHQQVKQLEPQHPWSLYRAAKKEMVDLSYDSIIGGYPQWRVNDIDFRKIKKADFVAEIKVPESERSVYYFKVPNQSEFDSYFQSL